MKRLILALILLCLSGTAYAQSWTVGAQSVSYPCSAPSCVTYTGVIGDNSTTQGGIAPGYSSEPADIASSGFTLSQWHTLAGARTASSPGQEAKFRTHCQVSHEAQEDPILFPGSANSGHLHTFFGNTLAGKDSTYTSLRTTGGSTCAGGPVNRTAYWFPSIRKLLPTGVTATIKPDAIVVYYTGDAADSPKMTRFPRDLKYIGGVDPSDFNDTARKAELNANYTYLGNGFGSTLQATGWQCTTSGGTTVNTSSGAQYSKFLKTVAGVDPWAGACQSGYIMNAVLKAPPCWDGVNRESPNGRDHLRYQVRHNNSGRLVCPTGWYLFPHFEGKIQFSHNGFSDYGEWYASSDRMNTASTPADAASLDPCRATGPYFCNGATMHFDWFGAWDYGTAASPGVMIKWMVNCNGIKIIISGTTLNGNPGACNDSTFDATTPTPNRLLTNGNASPDPTLSNDPVLNFGIRYYDDGPSRFFPLATGTPVPGPVQHTH